MKNILRLRRLVRRLHTQKRALARELAAARRSRECAANRRTPRGRKGEA